jgi:hypothetical protein
MIFPLAKKRRYDYFDLNLSKIKKTNFTSFTFFFSLTLSVLSLNKTEIYLIIKIFKRYLKMLKYYCSNKHVWDRHFLFIVIVF